VVTRVVSRREGRDCRVAGQAHRAPMWTKCRAERHNIHVDPRSSVPLEPDRLRRAPSRRERRRARRARRQPG
jgi:hypothetical protein